MKNKPIGIFDSGVGGLTVAQQVIKQLPNEEIVYFGDTARNPYGLKSKEEIIHFSEQIIRFLLENDVKAVIIACNTATIAALDEVVKEFDIPIFGVVKPGVEAVLNTTNNKKVGVIATEASIKSGSYQRLIKEANSDIEVFAKPCQLMVSIAEECLFESKISYYAIQHYTKELIEEGIDTLVLGCTHFPLHRKNIEKVLGDKIKLVDPALRTVEIVSKYLVENNMEREPNISKEHKFYVSGGSEKFTKICNFVLNGNYNTETIDIERY